jgi:midasin
LLLKALKPLCKENLELRATFSKIKELKNELSMVFEW